MKRSQDNPNTEKALLSLFQQQFPNCKEAFIVCAPGRLNIIGEHTDYNGLPVLPFALNVNHKIIFSPTPEKLIKFHSLHLPEQSPIEFKITPEGIPPYDQGHWGNYIKAAVQCGIDYARVHNFEPGNLKGLCGIIQSDLPPNAGLSSSSALVVGIALAFFHAQNWKIPPGEMANLTAMAEQYVGTRGGGMDQTTCLCGKKGACLKIYFYPLELSLVPINTKCSFLVSNSLVDARKSRDVLYQYNQRVLECRLVAEILKSYLSKHFNLPQALNYLGDLRKYTPALFSKKDWKDLIEDCITQDYYSLQEVEQIVGTSLLKEKYYPSFKELLKVLPERLPLQKRIQYLFDEWERVEQSAKFLEQGDLDNLGGLLYEAHEGMTHLYEVSHPCLNELVDLALEYGLPGARLVGAGFGGSVLHLVPTGMEADYIKFLCRRFYDVADSSKILNKHIHIFHPDDGASVQPLQG